MAYLLPVRTEGDKTDVLTNMLHRMVAYPDSKIKTWDLRIRDLRGGHMEGILRHGAEIARPASKEDNTVIPKQFRRVGKWETVAN